MNRKSKKKQQTKNNPIRPGPYYDGIKQIKKKYRLAPLALAVIWLAWACLMAAMALHWTNWAITGINLQSVNSRHCLTLDTAWRSVTQAEERGAQVKKCLIRVDWYLFSPSSIHVVYRFLLLFCCCILKTDSDSLCSTSPTLLGWDNVWVGDGRRRFCLQAC